MILKSSILHRQSSPRRARLTNGFTLMELLIVMAIIAILMLIAIPTVGSLKKKANDLSAQNSVQVITKAELQYSDTYPANGFACTLPALGGDPTLRRALRLISPDPSGRPHLGLQVRIHLYCHLQGQGHVNGIDRFNSYAITAVPQTVGKTGDRGFCSDQSGIIKYDPAGGTNCTQNLGQ